MALERHHNITAFPIIIMEMHFAEHTLLGLICQFFVATVQKIYAKQDPTPIRSKRQRSIYGEVFFSATAAGEVCSVLEKSEVKQFFEKQIPLQSVADAMVWLRDVSMLVIRMQQADPEDYFLKISQEIHDILHSAASISVKSDHLQQTLLDWMALQDPCLMIGELSRHDGRTPASSAQTPVGELDVIREISLRVSTQFTIIPHLLKWVNPIDKLSLKNVAADQIQQLLELIDQQPLLTELEFSYSRLTPLEVAEIIERLQKHKTLVSLSFLKNTEGEPLIEESQRFFEESGARIAVVLANDSTRFTRLKFDYPLSYMTEEMEQTWLDALQHNGSLVELGQADNGIMPGLLSLLRRNERNTEQKNSTLFMQLLPIAQDRRSLQPVGLTSSSPERIFSQSPEPASSSQELTFFQSPEPANSSQELELYAFRSKRARH